MLEQRDFDSREELDRNLAGTLAETLRDDLRRQPRAVLALSGGSTPRGMLEQLSRQALDWERVDVILVDERWEAPDSSEANEGLVRAHLLRGPAAIAHLHPFITPADTPEEALPDLEARLASLPRPFSAVVLGMGTDGHTASWFPGADNLAELLDPSGPARVAVTRPKTVPQARVTLTLPAVLDCRHIHLQITGSEKRAVLEQAANRQLPVAQILRQTLTPVCIWWAP